MSHAPTLQPLLFACEGETLLGILHRPSDALAAARCGVVIVVGGPQYRCGSHRQFIQLASALAEAGHPVLRFDVRGMGDSSGAMRSFEQLGADIRAAIDQLLAQQPGLEQVVLCGLCDGASAALLYLHESPDPRVRGLLLINPWVRSTTSLARAQVKHYYRQRLLEPAFWRKLLAGRVAVQAFRDLLANLRAARGRGPAAAAPLAFQERMARAWNAFDGRILLALSGNDLTAREFVEFTRADPAWRGALERPAVLRHDLPRADHTLSERKDQHALESITKRWLPTLV